MVFVDMIDFRRLVYNRVGDEIIDVCGGGWLHIQGTPAVASENAIQCNIA